MVEEFTHSGVWWIPGHEDNPVAGRLTYTPEDGAILEVIGGELGPFQMGKYPIVCGALEDKRFVTLWDCLRTNHHFSSTGYVGSTWNATMAFLGRLFDAEDDLVIERMAIGFSELDLWLDTTDIPDGVTWSRKDASESAPYHDDFVAEFEGAKISIQHCLQRTGTSNSKVQVEKVVRVQLELDEALHIEDFLQKYVSPIRDFFTIAVGVPVLPMDIWARSPRGSSGVDHEMDRKIPFQVFYADIADVRPKSARIDRHRLFFRQSDILESLPDVFRRWMELCRKMGPALDLYFAMQYRSSRLFSDWKFLMMAQTMEAYHRRVHKVKKHMPEPEYKAVREKLESAIQNLGVTEDLKNSLVEHLKFGNDVDLRTRLRLVLNDVLAPYSTIVGRIVSDREHFITQVVKTRNYLTHYNSENALHVIKAGHEYYEATVKLDLLMRLCICRELGFSPELVIRLFTTNYRYSQLLD